MIYAMNFEISVTGFSYRQFEQSRKQLSAISARLGISLKFRWDRRNETILVEGETVDVNDALAGNILDEIGQAMIGEGGSIAQSGISWNQEREWWDCPELLLENRMVPICIDCPAGGASKQGLNTYHTVVSELTRLCNEWKGCASRELLTSYNDGWRVDSEVLTDQEFKSQLILESICIECSGELTAYFEAFKLFSGHCVVVDVDARRQPTNARLG